MATPLELGITTDAGQVAGAIIGAEKLAQTVTDDKNTPAMITAAQAQERQTLIDQFNAALQKHDPAIIRTMLASLP